MSTVCPPVLLTMADYFGTLAAARFFGQHGIAVAMAAPDLWETACRSRYVHRRLLCPPAQQAERLIEWLLEFGAHEPGYVLYPTSDDLAWLLAVHAEELGRHFLLYSPHRAAIESVLDKRSLHRLCEKVGLENPATWYPDGEGVVEHVARQATFPLLIKLRTQVLATTHSKGVTVRNPAELLRMYRWFVQRNRYSSAILSRYPDACLPMLQAYHPEAAEGTYVIAGFIDRSGENFVARAANKILQRPRRLGVGLCFEEAPLDTALADRVARLCRTAGFFGVFQTEFIRVGERYLLNDFNPRYYLHMAFEIARGLPLPELAYLGALGEEAALARAITRAGHSPVRTDRIFTHRFQFETMLLTQRASGRMSAQEVGDWRRWYHQHRTEATDAVFDPDDRLPAVLDAARLLKGSLRAPRLFLKNFAF